MPRGPRIDAPGATHHVVHRGIERREIFVDDVDREAFLVRLDRLSTWMRFFVFAWVLMPNHVHLVVGTELGVLSRLMARLGTSYALYFNARHGRAGHLFQNRFWSKPIEHELEGVIHYVHMNPVRAGIITEAELPTYPWCGFGAQVERREPRRFERGALGLAPVSRDLARIVCEECARASVSSVALAYGRSRRANAVRQRVVLRALGETSLTAGEVARALGLARSTVSQIISRSVDRRLDRPFRHGS